MKKIWLLLTLCSLCFVSCNILNPEDDPTELEKAMVKTEMTWTLDSVLVVYNYQSPDEYSEMLYPSDGIGTWSYTFYPSSYRFPKELCFVNGMTGEAVYPSKEYDNDYCKYICTSGDGVFSAGILCYYNTFFTFSGIQQDGWVEFMMREANVNWNVDVWTCTFNASEDLNGTVLERDTEYYSRVR